jgi:hypothetical protein
MQGKDQIPKFFTDYGEIRCKTAKGRKHFVFVNPNLAENNEMTTSMKTFIGLANYLPKAQEVATNFLLQKNPPLEAEAENHGADVEHLPEQNKGGEAVAQSPLEQNKGREDVAQLPPETEENEDALFSKVLFVLGKNPPIRVMLMVSPLKEKPYIWLKRMWFHEYDEATKQPASWLPCKGGYRFSVNDDGHEMHRFAKKCMLIEEGRREAMREKLERRVAHHENAVEVKDWQLTPPKRSRVPEMTEEPPSKFRGSSHCSSSLQ